jgi:lysophospholipase L1-like esterase
MSQQMISPADPCVQWMGRTAITPQGAVRLGFPGVSLTVRARTSIFALELTASSPDCYFDLSIDDGPFTIVRPQPGTNTLMLAENLDPSHVHQFQLVRRTESWQGTVDVLRLILPQAGELLPADPLPGPRLLFIGDSITCGACTERVPPDYPEGHICCNANRSFGMELGRRLGAQVHLVSYGGRGLVRDWQGLNNDQTNNAPVFFDRALPDDASTLWDHARYTPDAIVIALGTNDFNQGIPDEVTWVQAYNAFVQRLREVHPQAWILLANSPIFSARKDNGDVAKSSAIAHYLDETVLRRREVRDYQVEAVQLRYQPGTSKDAHPIGPQHLLIADDLEPVLRARLRW